MWFYCLLLFLYLILPTHPLYALSPPIDLPKPVSIILDSDMSSDINDALVFAQINAHVQLGEAKLLAVVTSVSNPFTAPAIRILNAWYGHPLSEIPIGAAKDDNHVRPDNYVQQLVDNFGPQFGISTTDSRANYPNALAIYRQSLAIAPDNSVVILSVGFLNNLSELLQSQADNISPLSGHALITRKVRRLVVMGGEYPTSIGLNGFNAEHNLRMDPASAANVMANWPTETVALGYSVGSSVYTKPDPSHNPATDPFALVWSLNPNQLTNGKRESWDTLTTLYAVRGLSNSFTAPGISGINQVDSTSGVNNWSSPGTGQVTYLGKNLSDNELAGILESLINQSYPTPTPTQPPSSNSSCTLDTRVYYFEPAINSYIDKITRGNTQYIRLESMGWSQSLLNNWAYLTQSPNAPCYQLTPEQCQLSTRVNYINNTNTFKESVTLGTKYYDWTSGLGWSSVNHDLASVARYRSTPHAPCYGTTTNACSFSSRQVLYRQNSTIYDEVITIGPNYYQYASDTGWLELTEHDLTAQSRYTENSSAPCYGKSRGSCVFTSAMRYYDKNNSLSESVYLGNMFYSWTAGTGWWSSPEHRLGYTPRFLETNGPCLVPSNILSPTPITPPNPYDSDADGDLDFIDYYAYLIKPNLSIFNYTSLLSLFGH